MKEISLTMPQISLLAGTRAALGFGMALLVADRLSDRQRRAAGWALFMVGAASTVPLLRMVLEKRHREEP